MFSIFHHLLKGKGIGWSVLRYVILAPAVLALIVLNAALSLE